MEKNKTDKQTLAEIEHFLDRIAEKFPPTDDPTVMTDIHLAILQDSGELLALDDNDNEIARCAVDEWTNFQDDDFQDQTASAMRSLLADKHETIDNMGLIKPFSFILETEEHEHLSELYLVDSDIKIIGGDLMDGLNEDLNKFFESLTKE